MHNDYTPTRGVNLWAEQCRQIASRFGSAVEERLWGAEEELRKLNAEYLGKMAFHRRSDWDRCQETIKNLLK